MMTDPIADMLTRVRNAAQIERPYVDMPASNMKVAVASALAREGYVWDHELIETEGKPGKTLRINLKYGSAGEPVFTSLQRVSKPGLRVYQGLDEFRGVLQGLGVLILSTSKGVLSDREAKAQHVGGEVICRVS